MHKLVLKLFELLKQSIYFLRIICAFLILMTILYWTQNLMNLNWEWMNFIKGVLDSILAFSNNIYSRVWDSTGVVIEAKYFVTMILLVIAICVLKDLAERVDILRAVYEDTRVEYKKNREVSFNKSLQNEQKKNELKLTEYDVYIQTKLKKRYLNQSDSNLDDQNKQMTDFIFSKTNVQCANFKQGFLYSFEDFSKVDDVLDTMFKVLHAQSRLDYSISFQIGHDIKKLADLAELDIYGKIIMAADTAYRYKFNTNSRYKTESNGIYQKDNGTIDVHEFKEIETT